MTTKKRKNRTLQCGVLYRNFSLNREEINEESRTVPLAFSSEEPVERWFGREILDHSKGSVRLERLQNGGAILVDHNTSDHVGRVEEVSIGSDRVGRVVARFGKSARAEEVFQDVLDGIRHNVSVGYRVHKAVLEEENDDGPDIYRINDWEPLEVSMVSVPADATVGVGRAEGEDKNELIITGGKRKMKNCRHCNAELEPHVICQCEGARAERNPAPGVDIKVATERAAEAAGKAERTRVSDIMAMADKHKCSDLARTFINNGKPVDAFRQAVLETRYNTQPVVQEPIDLSLNESEDRGYSILRAISAAGMQKGAASGLEVDISNEISKKIGRDTEGLFVPLSLRALNVGTTTAGGDTVDTDLLSMIDLLRNRMQVKRLGATVMSGLTSNVDFPRQSGSGSLTWTGEAPGSDISDSDATFDQVALAPKTAQSSTAYSRQLLQQSSIDMENFVRNDLTLVNALGLDLAAINGSGSSNQPKGILNTTGIGDVAIGTNGGAPTYAHIVNLWKEVAIDNADIGSLGFLTNAILIAKLAQTEKVASTGKFIIENLPDPEGMTALLSMRCANSNQAPSNLVKGTSSDCSPVIFGNWADLLIGEFGVMELIVDPYRLKKRGLIEVTSFMMVDIAVRHAESFAAIKDARDV